MILSAKASIAYLIFLSSYWISVLSIEPEFIWNVINATISDYDCPRVVLYSTENEKLVPANYTGLETILININEQDPEKVKLEPDKVKNAMESLDLDKKRPCIVMISIVNVTADTIADNATDDETQEYKLRYSEQLMKLLQFKTPMNCRKLVLVRLADDIRELYSCTKAAKYPRRLVPVWEQILFDFFSTVKVIQGRVTEEKELKVAQESGHWTWLCQDIIERLEEEEKCQRNNTLQCQEDEEAGKFSNLKGNNSICSSKYNFKARQ